MSGKVNIGVSCTNKESLLLLPKVTLNYQNVKNVRVELKPSGKFNWGLD
jgi:hypothetical protein